MIFGLGRLFYVTLLLINAVAVLSEERFLSRSMLNNFTLTSTWVIEQLNYITNTSLSSNIPNYLNLNRNHIRKPKLGSCIREDVSL